MKNTLNPYDYVGKVSKWLEHAFECEQMRQNNFDSIDVMEILDGATSVFAPEQIALACRVYSAVLSQYQPRADEYMAELVMTLEYTDKLEIHTFDELISGAVNLRQPPEVYLLRRHSYEYLPLEEYRSSFEQSLIKPADGNVYAFYSSDFDGGSYQNSYHFRHYPASLLKVIAGRKLVKRI